MIEGDVTPIAIGQTTGKAPPEIEKSEQKKKEFRIEIDQKLCKGCYFCVRFCPRGVFDKSDDIGKLGYTIAKVGHPEKCTGCKVCLLYCPDFAIAVEEKREK